MIIPHLTLVSTAPHFHSFLLPRLFQIACQRFGFSRIKVPENGPLPQLNNPSLYHVLTHIPLHHSSHTTVLWLTRIAMQILRMRDTYFTCRPRFPLVVIDAQELGRTQRVEGVPVLRKMQVFPLRAQSTPFAHPVHTHTHTHTHIRHACARRISDMASSFSDANTERASERMHVQLECACARAHTHTYRHIDLCACSSRYRKSAQ